ncbi:MAG: outer membrane beta-barrel protein [Cyclobacteriaceae bacterium]
MKKLLVSTLFVVICIASASAQSEGDWRASGSLVLNFDQANFGVNFGGEYFFTDQISAAPSYSNIFGSPSANAFNVDGRYYFTDQNFDLYALAGFASVSVAGFSSSGLNLGAGYVIPIQNQLSLGLQIKYTTPGSGALEMQGGLVYSF